MTFRLAIRVFMNGVLQSEERVDVEPEQLDKILPDLAEKHAKMMADFPGMIEIEFLDEPDMNERFFRIGTDKSQMVQPVEMDPKNPREALRRWGKQRTQ